MLITSKRFAAFFAAFSTAVISSPTTELTPAPNMLTVMGQGALPQDDFMSFTDCVEALSISYRAFQDAGVLVLIPPTRRTLETTTTDAGLWECLITLRPSLSIALEPAEFFDEVHEDSVLLSSISHADAVAMGVTGQVAVGQRASAPRNSTEKLEERTNSIYGVFRSEGSACLEEDFNYYYSIQCYSYPSAYYSMAASNSDATQCLSFTIWPHHLCKDGNYKTVSVAAGTTSTCQQKTTYSWHGYYC